MKPTRRTLIHGADRIPVYFHDDLLVIGEGDTARAMRDTDSAEDAVFGCFQPRDRYRIDISRRSASVLACLLHEYTHLLLAKRNPGDHLSEEGVCDLFADGMDELYRRNTRLLADVAAGRA